MLAATSKTIFERYPEKALDLPPSNESKRVLPYAAEEAEGLGHRHIGTEHVLLGLLREEQCFAAKLLRERGLRLELAREEVAKLPHHAPEEHRTRTAVSRHSALMRAIRSGKRNRVLAEKMN